MDSSENIIFPNFKTILNPLGPFNVLAVVYFPFGLSPNNWALTMKNQIRTPKNARKISF